MLVWSFHSCPVHRLGTPKPCKAGSVVGFEALQTELVVRLGPEAVGFLFFPFSSLLFYHAVSFQLNRRSAHYCTVFALTGDNALLQYALTLFSCCSPSSSRSLINLLLALLLSSLYSWSLTSCVSVRQSPLVLRLSLYQLRCMDPAATDRVGLATRPFL